MSKEGWEPKRAVRYIKTIKQYRNETHPKKYFQYLDKIIKGGILNLSFIWNGQADKETPNTILFLCSRIRFISLVEGFT